jgi:EAL and modified HD-GYP domain-containing signal transduction protein
LDDFVVSDELIPLVKLADIIKIDVMTQSRNNIAKQLCRLRQIKTLKFIAEKVETYHDFTFCRDLGFDYFQGYFFSKPKIVSGQKMPPGRMALLRLLAELQQSDIDIEKLQKIIETDVNLSVKLLRLLNSSFYSLVSKVRSIRQAIVYLGLQNIRNWASLVAMGSVDDKPRELMTMSLVRAKMCELLCNSEDSETRGMFFTVGLFSLLDAVFDRPMEQLLKHLPLTEEVNCALTQRQGLPGQALRCVEAHERGNWDFIQGIDFDKNLCADAYLEALDWARSI